MRYDGVVFDMDGTLVDSIPLITRVINGVIADIGMNPRTQDEIRAAVGFGIEQLLRTIGAPEQWVLPLAGEAGARYASANAGEVSLFPGVRTMLDTLSNSGISTAVLSNRPTAGLMEAVERLIPGHRFQSILGSSPGKPAKPEPGTLIETARRLSVHPSRILMVGDGEPDVLAAEAAGTGHMAVLWGYSGRESLVNAGARNFAETPEEITRSVLRSE